MTVREIKDYINAAVEYKKEEQKTRAYMCYMMSRMNIYAFNQPNKFPDIEKVFPNLFERENIIKKQDWRIMKARMIDYGNRRRERENNG